MATYMSAVLTDDIVTSETKLRRLKLKPWNRIVDILSLGNRWLEVASNIKKPHKQNEFLYSAADIRKLEDQLKYGESPAEAFLTHWSTYGPKQPTVGDLINMLVDSHLFQAAELISQEILKVTNSFPENCDTRTEAISRSFSETSTESTIKIAIQNSNCADVQFSPVEGTEETRNELQEQISLNSEVSKELKNTNHHPPVLKDVTLNSCIVSYRYKHLADVTGNFCDIPVSHGGFKIGEGAFGVVYRAYTEGMWVAVKKLKEAIDKQFFTELEILSQYKHENLLPLCGYSNDGPYCCIVYKFMTNGSLQERLLCLDNSVPIPWTSRFAIAYGTANGINYLHTYQAQPLIHRDIKSANVLLDDNLVPKLGDFGLARIGSSCATSSVAFTSNIYGTSVYMAREAFNGEVSVKLDTFSYGVVLLELLTGLPPYDASREETDLISYVEENCGSVEDIVNMLDIKGGTWKKDAALSLYKIAKRCIETRKKDRPTITELLPEIEKLSNDCQELK